MVQAAEDGVDGALQRVSVFRGLPIEALMRLAAGTTYMQAKHQIKLFAQGDRCDAVYAIIGGEGRVRIGSVSRRSKALMVEMFSKGDLFGELGVIDELPRTADAIVIGQVHLARISSACFRRVLNETPELGAALAKSLCQRLRRTYALLEDAAFETLEVRLARQVLYLLRTDSRKRGSAAMIGVRMNQGELADLLGATTRTIITILNEWRAKGIVHFDAAGARLTVHDDVYLQRLVGLLD